VIKEREMTCIVCPNGCSLEVSYEDKEVIEVQGALCNRGVDYARNEMTNPMRNLTSSVKVLNGALPLVSVRSNKPIPREKLKESVKLLRDIEVEAPVALHQVILEDILGTGANIIATREISVR
jgi:CxxC motif-containing protein